MNKFILTSVIFLYVIVYAGCSNGLVNDPNSPLSLIGFGTGQTGETGLNVASIFPSNNALDVDVGATIETVFTTDIDAGTISDSTFIVADSAYIPIPGTYSFPDARTVIFTPCVLLNLAAYNVLLTTNVKDSMGNNLGSDMIWFFTTISAGSVPDPTFNPTAGTYEGTTMVSIDNLDSLATIRFTVDGSNPTPASTIYTNPIAVMENTICPIKAIAYRVGFADSSISSAAYIIQVVTPTVAPPAGSYSSDQSITLATSIPGATLWYTNDGTDPDPLIPNGIIYGGPISLIGPGPTTTTLKAIAVKALMANSPIMTAVYIIDYTQVAMPVFTPPIGTYTYHQHVTISTATPGATIRYTTDGSVPTLIHGTTGNSVTVNDTLVLKAYAYKGGMGDSTVANMAGVPYIIAPTLTSRSPDKHDHHHPVVITLRGTGFKAGVTAKLTKSGQPNIVAAPITIVDSTELTGTFNITGVQKGKWNVVVTNTDTGTATRVEWFRVH